MERDPRPVAGRVFFSSLSLPSFVTGVKLRLTFFELLKSSLRVKGWETQGYGCFLTLAFQLELLYEGMNRAFCWINEPKLIGLGNERPPAVSNLPREGQDLPSGPEVLSPSG